MMRPEIRPEMLPPGAPGRPPYPPPHRPPGHPGPSLIAGYAPPGAPGVPGGLGGPGAGNGSGDQAFSPPAGASWTPVSPRLAWHRRVSVLLGGLLAAAAGGLAVWWTGGMVGAVVWVVAVVVACALGWIVAELGQRSLGYVERADDLLVTYGVLVRRLVVVPYGRMQYVDVTAGPLERMFGIATVRLHTAAVATDARIPGLPAAEAALLRDRLVQQGESRAIG
jgi:membrane protein YdbS with pleckstrin-like domain